jgi:hypothetical protein
MVGHLKLSQPIISYIWDSEFLNFQATSLLIAEERLEKVLHHNQC